MFEAREEILLVWSRVLEKTSEMLKIVKERNGLLKSSSDEESAFRKEEAAFENFLLNLEKFNKEHADEKTSSLIKILEAAVEDSLQKKKNAVSEHLRDYKEAAELTHEIERYKEYLICFLNIYSTLKLEEKEIPEDKMYELITLILLANENNGEITEINFFENSELFIKKISESNDPVFKQLILDDKQTITYGNTLENFLEKL